MPFDPEDRKLLDQLVADVHRIAQQSDEVSAFLMAPRGPKLDSRAQELDRLLDNVRAGWMTARMILWLSGFIAAVSGAWAAIKLGGR